MRRAMWGGRGGTRRRSRAPSLRVVLAKARTHTPRRKLFEEGIQRRWLTVGSRRRGLGFRQDDICLQRYPAILPVAQTGFLQVEVAFDPPPCFVGDLAFAQKGV